MNPDVMRIVKAFSVEKGMGGGADTEIGVKLPVFQVVAAFKAGLGIVGNLVLLVAEHLHGLAGGEIKLGHPVVVGRESESSGCKRRAISILSM